MLGVVEVRVEAVVSGLGRVGCTKLLPFESHGTTDVCLRVRLGTSGIGQLLFL